ncbi:MAG: SRPBCC family protein [Alphaproteobacteria bacterium]
MSTLISLTLAAKANKIPVTLADDHETVAKFHALVKKAKGKLHCDAGAPAAVLEVPDAAAESTLAVLKALPLIKKGVVLVKPGAKAVPKGTKLRFDPGKTKVRWAADFDPNRVKVPTYAYNEVNCGAPVEAVFGWLMRAPRWPEWYPNSANVKLLSYAGKDLQLGMHFTWSTFGVDVDTYVEEFVPPYRIAWRGFLMGSEVIHAWVFERAGAGSRLITEEVQRGFVCLLARDFFIQGLHENHQLWLERLAAQAEKGMPS